MNRRPKNLSPTGHPSTSFDRLNSRSPNTLNLCARIDLTSKFSIEMFVLEFKVKATETQYRAIDGAIRTTQFIRNKCVVRLVSGEITP